MARTEAGPEAELLDQLRRLGASDDLARAHPVDIAEALNLLDPRVAGRALSSLPFDLAVRVLEAPEFDRRAKHRPRDNGDSYGYGRYAASKRVSRRGGLPKAVCRA